MRCFLSCHIVMSPWRAVGALSCLTTSSLISGFATNPPTHPCLSLITGNTRLLLFFVTWRRGELAPQKLPQSVDLVYSVFCPLLLVLHFLTDSFAVSLSLPKPAPGPHSSASLLRCHRLPHLIAFVPHRVSLIRSTPPFPACLRAKRDRSLLSCLSHISGGRISIQLSATYCKVCRARDLNRLTQHLQPHILSIR